MSRDTRVLAGELVRDAVAGNGGPPYGPHVVIVEGTGAGARAALRDGLTIGRGSGATLRVDDPEVSRVHARVTATAGGFEIVDLRSKNGVAVNGRRMRGPGRLQRGDIVALGGARLRVDDAAPGSPCPEHTDDDGAPSARRTSPVIGAAAAVVAGAALAVLLFLAAA